VVTFFRMIENDMCPRIGVSLWFAPVLSGIFTALLLGGGKPFPLRDASATPASGHTFDAIGSPVDFTSTPILPEDPVPEKASSAAEVHFMLGRLHHLRGDLSSAMDQYQRASRRRPGNPHFLELVLVLGIHLNRLDEAARYALRAESFAGTNLRAAHLRLLGVHLARQGQWKNAARLYDHALERLEIDLQDLASGKETLPSSQRTVLRDLQKKHPSLAMSDPELGTLLHAERARICQIAGESARAAESFLILNDAWDHPRKYRLSPAMQDLLSEKKSETCLLMGESFLEVGRWSLARQAFEESYHLRGLPAERDYLQALLAAERGDGKAAWDRLKEMDPSQLAFHGERPYRLFLEVGLENGRSQEALLARLFEAFLQNGAEAPPSLGLYLSKTYLDEAKPEFAERILMLQAKNGQLTVEGFRLLFAAFARRGQFDSMLDLWGQDYLATGKFDDFSPWGDVLLEDADAYTAIACRFRKRLEESPSLVLHAQLVALGRLAMECGTASEAKLFWNRSVEEEPRYRSLTLLLWGKTLLEKGRPKKAVEVLVRAEASLSEGDVEGDIYPGWDVCRVEGAICHHLATALTRVEEYDRALRRAKREREIFSDSIRPYAHLGWILLEAGRDESAESVYTYALDHFGERYDCPRWRRDVAALRRGLSKTWWRRGERDRAIEQLERILDEFPEDAVARNDLGYLLAETGLHLRRALALILEAVESDPRNPSYRDSLGWVLFRLGEKELALEQLELALALEEPGKSSETVMDHYRHIRQAIGHLGEVRDESGPKTRSY
jgi:tetratricopeptide (TPR) repeat protein